MQVVCECECEYESDLRVTILGSSGLSRELAMFSSVTMNSERAKETDSRLSFLSAGVKKKSVIYK